MQIIRNRPPNFAAIAAVFPVDNYPGVIFAYAPDIYNPSGKPIPPELIAHEQVHIARQKRYPGGVEAWWQRYLTDPAWRFEEELLAHQAEYKALMMTANRKTRRTALAHVAGKLSAPLYGYAISRTKAERMILDGNQPA